MTIRSAIFCAALGIGAVGAPMIAGAHVYVDVDIAPPAPRVEVVPEARVGYVWAPGYWSWSGHDHVWVAGRWIHERHGHHWIAEHWEQHGSHWRFVEGHWD
jgi:WXXGXW repeat (2 copies)